MPSYYTSNTIERDIFASDETVPGHDNARASQASTQATRKAGVSTFTKTPGRAGRWKPLLLGSRFGLLT